LTNKTRGYVHRVDIRAELDDVWQALIDPAIIARWHVPDARVDARERGSYWMRLDANLVREAHIDVFKPRARLRLIYMPLPVLPDDNAVLVDDFLIDIDQNASQEIGATVTIVRLMGSGIPDGREWDAMYMRLRSGWERALLRLKMMFERPEELAARKSGVSPTRRASAGRQAPSKQVPPQDKLLEWPEPSTPQAASTQAAPTNPSTTPSPPTGWNPTGRKPVGEDDFLKWPEPTPTKKR
jgi:hypothetical protein